MSRMRRAFTLVELLVVIGIIAVLVGILLPTISSARKQATMAKCSSNQRQLVAACMMHANEHKGYFPLAGELNVKYVSGWDGMAQSLQDGMRQRYTYAKWSEISVFSIVPLPAALAPYLGIKYYDFGDAGKLDQQMNDREKGVWKMFMCPATESFNYRRLSNSATDATPANQGTMMSIFNNGSALGSWSTNTDYGMNEGALGFHYSLLFQTRRLAGNVARMRNPSQTMIFCDALRGTSAAYYFAPDPWIVFRPSLSSTGPVTMKDVFTKNTAKIIVQGQLDLKRHSGKMNVAFADGHIELIRIEAGDLSRVYLLPK